MPAPRLCSTCHQPTQGRGICLTCRTQRYGPEHRALRAQWEPVVRQGTVRCYRDPTHNIDPQGAWELDHRDDGNGSSPSCQYHNGRAPRGL